MNVNILHDDNPATVIVTEGVPYVPPSFVSATVLADGRSVEIVLSNAITGGSATLGFTIAGTQIESGSYTGSTVTLIIPTVFDAASVGAIAYDADAGTLTTAIGDVESFGPESVTNNSTVPTLAFSTLGSGLLVSGTGSPRLGGMTGTEFAFYDSSLDKLRKYTANLTSGAVSLNGTETSIASDVADIVGMNTSSILMQLISGGARSFRGYTYSGSSFSANSITSSTNNTMALTKVNSSLVMVSGDVTSGTYNWSGSALTLNTSSIAGSGSGMRIGCYLEDNRIALFSPAVGGYNLGVWLWSGSAWSQSGSDLFISTAATLGRSCVTALTNNKIITYWSGAAGGRVLRTFDLSFTKPSEVGAALSIGNATASEGAVEALGSANFVYIDTTDSTLRVYAIT